MLKARGKLNVVLLSWERNVGPHYQSKNCDEKCVVAVVPGLAGLAMLLTALLMQARVEGNQDSPCLVRLPNFRGVCG